MTPEDFFATFVIDNQFEFHENPGSLRCAFNAAIAASHCADHYFHFHKKYNRHLVAEYPDKSIKPFLDHLSAETNGAFGDVRSIANVYKHLYRRIGKKFAPEVAITSCGAIYGIELHRDAFLTGIREDFEDRDSSAEAKRIVVFARKNGSEEVLLPALDAVVAYLDKLIGGN